MGERIDSASMIDPLSREKIVRSVQTDLATVKTVVDEVAADSITSNTWDTEVDADLDTINNRSDFNNTDGVIEGSYSFTAGQAAATLTTAGYVRYRIGGVEHYSTAVGTPAIEDNSGTTDIADGRFGAWRILIDRSGTISTQKASANQQHTSAEIAMLTFASKAQTANTCCLGYVVLGDAGAAYNIGTVNMADLTTENYYYERAPRKQVTGLHTALGAATVASAGAATLAVGTIDAQTAMLQVAQIAADATDDMTDADTIATTETGGWLLVTDLAGTGTSTIASDGLTGVSVLADTNLAGANTALDLVADRLPSVFCILSRIVLVNASSGTFTAGTTNWDATDMTATVTDATVGTWDRTASGFDSHQINPPDAPGTITAPVTPALTGSIGTLSTQQS